MHDAVAPGAMTGDLTNPFAIEDPLQGEE